jgi:hypothetical protein
MATGRGRAGTHTTLTDAARPVAAVLERHGRVSRGVITAGLGARTFSIKVVPITGGLRVTVVSKGSRQDLRVYGLTVERVRMLLGGPDFAHYLLNLPK